MNSTTNFPVLLLSFSVFTITGCTNFINLVRSASSQVIEIKEIKSEDFLQNSLKVEGTVEKIIPLLNSYVYLLKDKTELIWVVTNNQAPTKGQTILIEGLLKNETIVIDGQESSEFYLEEIQRFQPN